MANTWTSDRKHYNIALCRWVDNQAKGGLAVFPSIEPKSPETKWAQW